MMSIFIGDVLLILEVDFGVLGISMVLLDQCIRLTHDERVSETNE
jgi:hypothetical protein